MPDDIKAENPFTGAKEDLDSGLVMRMIGIALGVVFLILLPFAIGAWLLRGAKSATGFGGGRENAIARAIGTIGEVGN